MPTVLGLDLGKHTFRAVEIEKNKKETVLLKTGVYDNPKINLEDTSNNAQKDYSQAIRDFIKDTGFTTSKTVFALEEKDIFMRVINVPEMSDKELKSSITYEAEQYIPLPLNEVNLTFQKLDIPSSLEGKMSIQLVAAKKDVIQKYISVVKDAKLTPVGVEPEALAIGRALSDMGSPSASIILHLGFQKSLIIISVKGSVVFTRTLSLGGDAMTRSIEQSLNLDYMQAEEYKKVYGLNQDQAEGKIYTVLKPVFDNIIGEVGRAQVFFTTHHPNVNINRVILSGGTALMPGLLLYMANNLSLEVELANPFKDISFAREVDEKKDWHVQNGPLFSAPIGLALKEI